MLPTNANTEPGEQIEQDHNHQVDGNDSIGDNHGGDNKDDNTTEGGTTPPTKPTDPVDPEPTDPEPTEPVDPEPIDPEPVEPEPEPKPTFALDAEHLRGTKWYDENKNWYLTFNTEGNSCRISNADDNVILSGTWELKDNCIIFKPDSNITDNLEFAYSGDDATEISLTETTFGDYKFVLLPNT